MWLKRNEKRIMFIETWLIKELYQWLSSSKAWNMSFLEIWLNPILTLSIHIMPTFLSLVSENPSFCVADFATLSDERRSRSKFFYNLIWIKEPCVRKFKGLARLKLLGISQTIMTYSNSSYYIDLPCLWYPAVWQQKYFVTFRYWFESDCHPQAASWLSARKNFKGEGHFSKIVGGGAAPCKKGGQLFFRGGGGQLFFRGGGANMKNC